MAGNFNALGHSDHRSDISKKEGRSIHIDEVFIAKEEDFNRLTPTASQSAA